MKRLAAPRGERPCAQVIRSDGCESHNLCRLRKLRSGDEQGVRGMVGDDAAATGYQEKNGVGAAHFYLVF